MDSPQLSTQVNMLLMVILFYHLIYHYVRNGKLKVSLYFTKISHFLKGKH